jgi:tRNA(Phe) wybutosine-synthesizing methylase Tyw3
MKIKNQLDRKTKGMRFLAFTAVLLHIQCSGMFNAASADFNLCKTSHDP